MRRKGGRRYAMGSLRGGNGGLNPLNLTNHIRGWCQHTGAPAGAASGPRGGSRRRGRLPNPLHSAAVFEGESKTAPEAPRPKQTRRPRPNKGKESLRQPQMRTGNSRRPRRGSADAGTRARSPGKSPRQPVSQVSPHKRASKVTGNCKRRPGGPRAREIQEEPNLPEPLVRRLGGRKVSK